MTTSCGASDLQNRGSRSGIVEFELCKRVKVQKLLPSFQGQKRRNEKQERADINRIRVSMVNLLQPRLLDNDSVWNTHAPLDTLSFGGLM